VWPKQTSECKNLSLVTKCQGGNCNSFVALFKTVYKQCLDEANSSVSTFKSCNKWKDRAAYYNPIAVDKYIISYISGDSV